MRMLVLAAFLMAPFLVIGATPVAACECCPCGCGCGAPYDAPTYVYTYHCGPYYGPPRACLGGYFGPPTWGWRAFPVRAGWHGYRWGSHGYGYRRGGWRGYRMGWREGRRW